MTVLTRPGESPVWARWVNARYAVVAVQYREGMHLALPGSPTTLCMRRVARDARVEAPKLCPACRDGAKAAWQMRSYTPQPPDRARAVR